MNITARATWASCWPWGVCSTMRCYPSAHKSAHTHQLARQQWHILDDGQPDPPFGIFSQLHYGREEWLGELPDPNHFIYTVQIGDDVQTNFRTLQIHKTQKSIYKDQVLWSIFSTTMMSKYILKWESVDLDEKTIVLEEILNTEYTNN